MVGSARGEKLSWESGQRGEAGGQTGEEGGRLTSATLPDFDCLIHTSCHHVGSRLMEICEGPQTSDQLFNSTSTPSRQGEHLETFPDFSRTIICF